MSTVDVKSLFKSGKKTIKAFKVAGGPAPEAVAKTEKSHEETMEHWEAAPVVVPATSSGMGVSMGMDDFKGESEESISASKPTVSWKEPAAVVEEKPKEVISASAYVPPSQRRAEAAKSLPSLEEVAKLASAQHPVRTTSTSAPTAGTPSRLKLITSATKKAMEEEAKKKEEDKLKKEQEKQARKEQLKAEMGRQASSSVCVSLGQESSFSDVAVESASSKTTTIQAASLSDIYAKYVDRPKKGRTMVAVASH